MSFDLGNYEDVAHRRARFLEQFPEGSIQVDPPEHVTRPDGQTFVRVRAVVYRRPTDCRPGIDWTEEPCPGKTPYTKGSEVENASTSAIGRAILCVLPPLEGASGASREEVQARAETEPDHPNAERVAAVVAELRELSPKGRDEIKAWADGRSLAGGAMLADEDWLSRVESWLDEAKAASDG